MFFLNKIQFYNKTNILQLILSMVICISGCKTSINKPAAQSMQSENQLIYNAERFFMTRMDGYTRLTIIDPWQGAINISNVYNLVPRGSELPGGIDPITVIRVPLENIICMSTTYLAMITALNEEATIKGVSGKDFIFSQNILKKIEAGLINDVGYEANLNKELILKISPDLIMMYGIGSESTGYIGKLKELGVPVMFNADYLETDPLSRAEWLKVFGALYCKESLADSIYNAEVEAYNKLRSYIDGNISERPAVMLGLPFKDTWYISPGNSYISKLINDAGGNYLWRNTESAISMPFGLENVYLKAMDADFWLNIGAVNSKDEISALDPRLKELPCYQEGNLYNNNKRITAEGGNDYWESGTVHPHLILKDIASILHTDLFGDNELFFYRNIK